jgi:hypothetical protein
MYRRNVLASAGVALSALFAGCSEGSPPGTSTRSSASSETANQSASTATDVSDSPTTSTETSHRLSVQTPAGGDCRPVAELRPTPDSARAYSYPNYPDSLTASTAESFATAYERAYRHNSRLTEYESVQVSVTAPEWAVSETRDGFAVGLDGRVQFDDTETQTSATPLPSGFFEFSVWYYLTDRFVLRGDANNGSLEEGTEPDVTPADAVACASPATPATPVTSED